MVGFASAATLEAMGTAASSSSSRFPASSVANKSEPREVPARSGETGHEPLAHRVPDQRKDDRDRPGHALGGLGEPVHDEHINLQPDQLSRQPGEPVPHPFRIPLLDGDGLSFDITQGSSSIAERLELAGLGRGEPQETDPRHLRRLRLDGERRHQEAEGASNEGSPVHYWMTSSARASTAGGMVRPRAFAVLRLMVRAILVGRSTGRSPAFAPFSTLSTNRATSRAMSASFTP